MIAPRIKNIHSIPYGGGYSLNLPEKGMVGGGKDFSGLMGAITKYRHANGLPCGLGLEDEVQREVCAQWPQECKETSALVPGEREFGLADVVAWVKTIASHKLSGAGLVEQQEAERRAAICAKCDWQATVVLPCGNALCGELANLVHSVSGGKSTSLDGQLKTCRVCGCYNRTAIWFPVDVQWNQLSETQKAQFQTAKELFGCWKYLDQTPA